jgi:hypothetical protein
VATNGTGSSAPVESAASAAIVEAPPANETQPAIDGAPHQGALLTADHGTWSGNPTGYSYQWRRCNPGNPSCSDIAGATDSTYTVVANDVGDALEVRVTATNAGGDSDPADSALTSTVPPGPPVNQTPPSFSGFPQVGERLVADPGEWSNNPTSYAYQWFSCDAVDCFYIDGATEQSYLVQPADVGLYIGVEVVASNAGGDSEPADSDAFGPVIPAAPQSLSAPHVSGTAQAGHTLTLNPGTWSGAPTAYFYQWFSCDSGLDTCNEIPGATGSTYLVSAGDIGRRLIAGVIAENDGGDSGPEFSNVTDPVLPAVPANLIAPTVSGKAQQGKTLTAASGSWSNNPTAYGYQWERCGPDGTNCVDIAGATAATYRAGASDVGATLVVEVVAVNAGGKSAPAISPSTGLELGPDCHVPNVLGLKLAKAKTRIRAGHCRVGRITKKKTKAAKRGRVLSERPRHGRTLPNGTKVKLLVGKG